MQKKGEVGESERSQAEQWRKGLLNIVPLLVRDVRVHVCVIQLGEQGTRRAMPTVIDFRL